MIPGGQRKKSLSVSVFPLGRVSRCNYEIVLQVLHIKIRNNLLFVFSVFVCLVLKSRFDDGSLLAVIRKYLCRRIVPIVVKSSGSIPRNHHLFSIEMHLRIWHR